MVQAADLLASLCKDAFEITLSGAAQNPKLEELQSWDNMRISYWDKKYMMDIADKNIPKKPR